MRCELDAAAGWRHGSSLFECLPRLGLVLVAALIACSGDGASAPADKGTLTVVVGDSQSGVVGTPLAPLQVKVTGTDGQPQSGVTVTWTIVSGGGALSAPTSVTDAAGVAEVTPTVGLVAGRFLLTASVRGYAGSPVAFSELALAGPASSVSKSGGDNQVGAKSQALTNPLTVRVADSYGNAVAGVTVTWAVATGGGTLSNPTSVSDINGLAQDQWTLGPAAGSGSVTATLAGGATVTFHATTATGFTTLGGGSNVTERYSSDLSVANGYAYTGTWNWFQRTTGVGGAIKVFQLGAGGAPALVDSVLLNNVITVSDLEVSPDGQWLVATAEGGPGGGVYAYSLANPAAPQLKASSLVGTGLHTGSLAVINNTLYAFGAKDPSNCALMIFNLSAAGSGSITVASSTPIPDHYCIHDTFVRDGYAFVFAWDEGLYIYDVGNGALGGSPTSPKLVSHTGDFTNPLFGGETHNGWWFHNPVTGEKRYLFIGQEGPGTVGASSSGDIHVVDVSNLAAPVEVASFHLAGAGTHNFWMDEANQRLYAAYYNGGVVALDVSGTLSGDLSNRLIGVTRPGGNGNTYMWGVQLYNGSLYAIDMLSGLWQLGVP